MSLSEMLSSVLHAIAMCALCASCWSPLTYRSAIKYHSRVVSLVAVALYEDSIWRTAEGLSLCDV